jgi:hypothetical protein
VRTTNQQFHSQPPRNPLPSHLLKAFKLFHVKHDDLTKNQVLMFYVEIMEISIEKQCIFPQRPITSSRKHTCLKKQK